MRKGRIALLILLTVLFCAATSNCLGTTGCSGSYFSKTLVPNSKWVSENPEIWFVMDDEDGVGFGEIVIDGEVRLIEVGSLSSLYINYNDLPSGVSSDLLAGSLQKKGKDWFTVEIYYNTIPDSAITKITFRRATE